MQTSIRSYLTAGTVAVVGAGAIALAPVVPVTSPGLAQVPAPAIAEVALTGLSLSLTDVLGLLQNFGIGGALPGILTALPSLLPTDIINAVITEFVGQAGPLLTTAATEVLGYLGTAVTGLLVGPDSIPVRVVAALAAVPTVLASAVGSLVSGDLGAALQTVVSGLVAPISSIGQAIADATTAFQSFVTTKLNGLITTLPGVLFGAVQAVLGTNLQSLVSSIGTAIAGLFGGLVPAAASVSAVSAGPGPAASQDATGTIVCDMPAVRSSAATPTGGETAEPVAAAAVLAEPVDAVAPAPHQRRAPLRQVAEAGAGDSASTATTAVAPKAAAARSSARN